MNYMSELGHITHIFQTCAHLREPFHNSSIYCYMHNLDYALDLDDVIMNWNSWYADESFYEIFLLYSIWNLHILHGLIIFHWELRRKVKSVYLEITEFLVSCRLPMSHTINFLNIFLGHSSDFKTFHIILIKIWVYVQLFHHRFHRDRNVMIISLFI